MLINSLLFVAQFQFIWENIILYVDIVIVYKATFSIKSSFLFPRGR